MKLKQKKKVRFSYDDILSSLNLVVRQDGALQYMSQNNNSQNNLSNTQLNNNYTTKYKEKPSHNYIQNNNQNQMKNSYIYNKYFKNYKDPTIVEEKPIPKTKEEYKKMLIEENIKRMEAIKRIQQIKSTKMFFSNNMRTSTSQQVTNLNRIFRI